MNAPDYYENYRAKLEKEGASLRSKAAALGWTLISADFDTGKVVMECAVNPVARREFVGLREVAIFLDGLQLGAVR